MRKISFILTVLATILLGSCSQPVDYDINTVEDLDGRDVAYLGGAVFPIITREYVDNVTFHSFGDHSMCVQALRAGKVDAMVTDEVIARLFMSKFPGELEIATIFAEDDYGFAFIKGSELIPKVNEAIRGLKSSGELDRMRTKWFNMDSDEKALDEVPDRVEDSEGRAVLRFAADPVLEPMCYMGPNRGELVGLEIDILRKVASELDMALKIVPMNTGGLLEALVSGRVDMVGGFMSTFYERSEKVDFCESYYTGGVTILRRNPNPEIPGATSSWGKRLASSINRTYIRDQRWKLILGGLDVSIRITLLAALLGTLLALGLCALRLSKNSFWVGFARVYVAIMKGTPILVVLMILYYVVFARWSISPILIAVIAFSLNYAAYVGETLRLGIESIPKGQTEAALALGFTKLGAFREVVLPQVLRRTLPLYHDEFVAMLKMTSVVGYIAIQDLTKISDIIRARTYEAFFPLVTTALIYFLAAHILASVLTYVKRQMDPDMHRAALLKNEGLGQ